MTLLLKRYWLAFIRRIARAAQFVEGVCNDAALARVTRFSWAQARLARACGVDLTCDDGRITRHRLRNAVLMTKPLAEADCLLARIDELFPATNGDA